MRSAILLFFAAFCWPTSAKTVECPKKLDGKELHLAGAYFDKETQIQGVQKEVKGGFIVELPLNVKWLACDYGQTRQWIPVKDGEKAKRCSMSVREGKRGMVSAKLSCN